MPSSLLNADTSFPQFTRESSDSEKIEKICSYLFMLLEQLRYSLSNLDKDNFNEAGLEEIGEIIVQPVYIRLDDAEGNIHQLSVTAELLRSRIEDTEGNVSELIQTSKILSSTIADVAGNMSSLTQTVNSFRLGVVNGESSSTITLTANGAAISSQNISFSGMVTFSGLADGTTTIDGACIKTGLIDASRVRVSSLYGRYIYLCNNYGAAMGQFSVTGADTASAAVELESYGALRLKALQGAAYMEASSYGRYIHIQDMIYTRGPLVSNNMSSLGTSGYPWSDVYANNAVIQASDLTVKKDVEYGLSRYDALFDALRPMSFRFIDGESGRRHVGLGAQDVERAMEESGISDMEFAGFIKSPKEDGGGFAYALRYGELIPLCIEQIQRLKSRVNKLEQEAEARDMKEATT